MAKKTKILWADHSANFWWGCSKAGPGCAHCYAEAWARRFRKDVWGLAATTVREWKKEVWSAVPKWNKQQWVTCPSCGWRGNRRKVRMGADPGQSVCPGCDGNKMQPTRQRVFVQSMADFFEEHSQVRPWRHEAFALMQECTNLDFMLLTKRPENVQPMLREAGWKDDRLPQHFWIGVSASTQAMVDKRLPALARVPAAVRFLSLEPLLEPIKLHLIGTAPQDWHGTSRQRPVYSFLDWVIGGGESGSQARPMHPDWARDLRDECAQFDIPFFFKQWGAYCSPSQMSGDQKIGWEVEYGTETRWDLDDPLPWRVGKKRAGRLLDGREWSQFPQTGLSETGNT